MPRRNCTIHHFAAAAFATALIAAAPSAAGAQSRCSAPPGLVQNITVAADSRTATIRWSAPGATDFVTKYLVSFAPSATGNPLTTTDVGLARSHQVILPPGDFFLRVHAHNACGDGPLSSGIAVRRAAAEGCSAAPFQARNLRGRVESGSLIWTWEAPVGGDRVDAYVLEVGSWPGGADIGTSAVNGFSYVTTPQSAELHARVRARNTCGLGAPSDDARVAGTARTLERTSADRPDEGGGYEVKIMYVVPSDGDDRRLDVDGTLVRTVAAIRKWFERASGRTLRIDTFNGMPDIAFVRLNRTDAAMASVGAFVRDEVQRDIAQLGFNDPRKVYAVYYGGTSTWACGGGAWPPTLVGSVAALYLNGLPTSAVPCSANRFTASIDQVAYLEFAMLHEVVHTLGFVATCAPNHTRSGHASDDPRDLMYAGDAAWRPSILDINRDDYFAHGRNCGDLSKSVFLSPADPSAGGPPGWTSASLPAGITAEELEDIGCRLMPDGPHRH